MLQFLLTLVLLLNSAGHPVSKTNNCRCDSVHPADVLGGPGEAGG